MYSFYVKIFSFSLFIWSCDSQLDDLEFTCRTHAGCEVFDVCTRNAMSKLQEELGEIVEGKLKETNKSWTKDIEDVRKITREENMKSMRQLQEEIESNMSKKLTRINSRMNASLEDVKQSLEEKTFKELKDANNKINEEVQGTVNQMKVTVRKARREMDDANKKGFQSLKSDTNTLVNAKFSKVTKEWNEALTETKDDLTATIDKAMEKMRNQLTEEVDKKLAEANATRANDIEIAVLKSKVESQKTIDDMSEKLKLMEEEIKSISSQCNSSMEKLEDDIKKRFTSMTKGNITMNTVEMMIDAKFKEASAGWSDKSKDSNVTDDDDDEVDYPTHNTSVTRRGLCKVYYQEKCFWVVEPELAIPYAEAPEECLLAGGEIANIYTTEHLELLKIYLRSLISETRMYIDVWLGMQINPENGDVKYTNDSMATFLEWEPGSPSIGEPFFSWTGMYLVVKKDPEDKYVGMVNSWPGSIRDGVLCEI